MDSTVVGNGFAERTDPAALVVGPTGLALGDAGPALRGRHREQPDRGDPLRPAAMVTGGRWRDHRLVAAGLSTVPWGWPWRPTATSSRQCRGREHRRDHAVRPAGRLTQIDPAGAGGDLFGLTIAPNGRRRPLRRRR